MRTLMQGSFELLPYDECTNGMNSHPITHKDQLPMSDPHAYGIYYHNHCITAGHHLTGMVQFNSHLLWHKIKEPTKPYFNWLKSKGIFMNKHTFQMDTITAAGWFFNVLPNITQHDNSISKLPTCLAIPDEIRFQLMAKISVSLTSKAGQ